LKANTAFIMLQKKLVWGNVFKNVFLWTIIKRLCCYK
jgi:hypothetical protein